MSMTLEPCPFCGSIPEQFRSGMYGDWLIRCLNPDCEACVSTKIKEEAIAAWNARAHLTQPAQSVDVEKVREVIAELRGWDKRYHGLHGLADKLTAALQEKGNG